MPVLVIGGFAAYTYLSNAQPPSGLMRCDIEPQIVFTGDPVSYKVSFLGDKARPAEMRAPPPLDIIFAVDTSGSMHSSLPDMVSAARTVADELVASNPSGHIRFALSQFHDSSEIKLEWNTDPAVLHSGLSSLDRRSGNSGTVQAFEVINHLVGGMRNESTKVLVLYTDGHIGINESIINTAESLRSKGVHVFSISPPGYNTEGMSLITGYPSRVLHPTGVNDLIKRFRMVADEVMGLYGDRATLFHNVDRDNFIPSLPNDSEWQVDALGYMQLNIGYLPYKLVNYTPKTLIPQHIGQWKVALNPPEARFIDMANKAQSIACDRRPSLLVISWWLLILVYLPALLWLLHYLLNRRPALELPEYAPPPIHTLPPPSPLPLPSSSTLTRKPVVPTLFVGLGGTGRQTLLAIQEQLRASHLEASDLPYRFLWIDIDAHEKEKNILFQGWPELTVKEAVAPKEIRQTSVYLEDYLPPMLKAVPAHLQWFQPIKLRDTAADRKDLSRGGQGQRILARFALFKWLETDNLLNILQNEHKALLNLASIDNTRQIILFADRTGGVGSAWTVDIARLFRRIGQIGKPQFTPEIIAVLGDDQGRVNEYEQSNLQALTREMETACLAGSFPQHVCYRPGHDLLDTVDNQAPFNYVFAFNDCDRVSMIQQCADFGAVLVERYPRYTLFKHPVNRGQIMETQVRGIHVLPDLDYQLVKREILLRILGTDVLLDLETVAEHLAIKSISEEHASKLLSQWNSNEPPGTPWQFLLLAVTGIAGDTQFFDRMNEVESPNSIWFQQAFSASLNRLLRGKRIDGRWERTCMPGEAVATLRLFAQRLEQQLKSLAPPNSEIYEMLQDIIRLARNSADSLQAWMKTFIPLCEEIVKEQEIWLQQCDMEKIIATHTIIQLPGDKQRISQWSEQALRQWVGSEDVISALCERVYFNTRLDNDELTVTFAVQVDTPQEFSSAQDALSALQVHADAVAHSVPVLKVEGTLANLHEQGEEKQLQTLSGSLVNSQEKAEQVIMVTPSPVDSDDEIILQDFCRTIANPPGQATASNCYGDDYSALRRLQLRTENLPLFQEQSELPFVQAAEQAAEQVRKRAMQTFELELPIFPTALRIALAHSEPFQSFAKAYKAGHIVRQPDTAGMEQWLLSDQNKFLTFGKANGLADAAANYVYLVKKPASSFVQVDPAGDFSEFDNWLDSGAPPHIEDVFVLIAMRVFED